ncbi:MAG: transporter substrate-binding domain-containing protein [Deltaproteobacteria bacterium]|nr:transporter substrate-binding domain-containing protein [Deltaproteobacteria bacterium]
MKAISFIAAFLMAIVFDIGSHALADECVKVSLLYNERTPYLITSGDRVTGLTADPVAKAFEKAGIHYQWVSTPAKRQILILQENCGCDCGVGWFKNPDREKFALFSTTIYKDEPQVAIVRKDDMRIKDASTLGEVLDDKQLRLLIKDGYSYGALLDEIIEKGTPTIIKTTAENVNMISMIKNHRGDYFILAPEEAESLVKEAGFKMSDFRLVAFSDMPPGNVRYLMCSKKVGGNTLKIISEALSGIVQLSN